MLREIISTCVLVIVVTNAAIIQGPNPISNNKPAYYRLPNHARPLQYDLELNLHLAPGNFTFDGHVLIDIEILNRTRILTLHSKNLAIDETATYLMEKPGFDTYIPARHEYNDLTESLSLDFDKEMPIGHYVLCMKFLGTLNDKPYGLHRNSYTDETGDTVWFAVTNFAATYARNVFPCWDEPALKAAFRIAIKHRHDYTAISNMPVAEVSKIDEDDDKVWTHFGKSPVMSTYLVGFLVSDFRNVSNSDGTINVWTRGSAISSADFAHDIAQKVAIELERYTNGSIWVPKIDHVALPGLSNKAVQSWGFITYREATMLHSGDYNNPTERLYKVVDDIIYQSTYQWFGNAVTPSWWTDTWMNGGIAAYLKYYIIDKMYSNAQVKQFFLTKTLNFMLFVDNFDNEPLNWEPNTTRKIELKLHPYYEHRKAFLLFRMLSHCLTEDVFHAGLIKYLDEHKYSVVQPHDLWSALQDVFDESAIPENKFSIQEVMNTWIGQKGYPLVTVTTDDQTGRTILTQEYFQSRERLDALNASKTNDANMRWWIPINFATRSNPDFSSTAATAWLPPEVDELVITNITVPQDWIIANIQHMGFYRVNYDPANWLKIADYLDSENYSRVHVLNRAQLVNDAVHLMLADKLDPEIFMSLTRYLRRETDCTVWYTLFLILKESFKVFKALTYNDGDTLLKSYVLDLMDNVVESVGVRDRPDDDYLTKIMRHGILEKACECDHPTCLREAHAQLIVYLENPELTNSTSFYKRQWIFCNGVKLANESVWNKLLHMHTESAINCLGHSKNLTIIENFLNMTISDDSPIPKKNIYHIFDSILNNDYLTIDMAIDFIAKHWDKYIAIYGLDDATDLLHNISWSVISKKQKQKVKALMKKLNLELPEQSKREQELDRAQIIVNKIRLWLERRNASLSSTTPSQ